MIPFGLVTVTSPKRNKELGTNPEQLGSQNLELWAVMQFQVRLRVYIGFGNCYQNNGQPLCHISNAGLGRLSKNRNTDNLDAYLVAILSWGSLRDRTPSVLHSIEDSLLSNFSSMKQSTMVKCWTLLHSKYKDSWFWPFCVVLYNIWIQLTPWSWKRL